MDIFVFLFVGIFALVLTYLTYYYLTDIYKIQKTIPLLNTWVQSAELWKQFQAPEIGPNKEDGEPPVKKARTKPISDDTEAMAPTFRVSCKCAGKARKLVDTQV